MKIVDESYVTRPFVIMHTSKDQSHASCPLSKVIKKDVKVQCSDEEGLRDGVPGKMEEKLGSDDEKRKSYTPWEEHEKWGQMKEVFSWKINNKQLVPAETCDHHDKTPSKGKMVKKIEKLPVATKNHTAAFPHIPPGSSSFIFCFDLDFPPVILVVRWKVPPTV